jgi:hypothetical protein
LRRKKAAIERYLEQSCFLHWNDQPVQPGALASSIDTTNNINLSLFFPVKESGDFRLRFDLITDLASGHRMFGAFSYECDDACLLPGAPVPAGKYAVVSPVGKQTVQMITQAPRLDTLEGKTIAVVGGSFMANITHPEIKRLILANYPTAKVILLNEIGSAGPLSRPRRYPRVERRVPEEAQRDGSARGDLRQRRLRAMHAEGDGIEHRG